MIKDKRSSLERRLYGNTDFEAFLSRHDDKNEPTNRYYDKQLIGVLSDRFGQSKGGLFAGRQMDGLTTYEALEALDDQEAQKSQDTVVLQN